MKKLRRIVLFNFKPSNVKNVKILKTLYLDYLRFDPLWHFFWEGNVTYLRVTNKPDLVVLLRQLDHHKVKFAVDEKDWEDNIPITREYQDAFIHIFHGFSILAMTLTLKKIKKSEKLDHILRVLERTQHCFLNNIAHVKYSIADMTAKFYTDHGFYVHEPYMLLLSMLKSGHWTGYYRKSMEKKK
jgi:hypothetical protein